MWELMRYFPFEKVRAVQNECIDLVSNAISSRRHLIMHAPTGLGKTVATLVPGISYALEHNKTVFFLTSRNSQHQLAIETVRLIKEKGKANVLATDIVGKQWMCSVPRVEKLYSTEFAEYCKKMREERECIYFEKTRKRSGKPTVEAERLLNILKLENPMQVEAFTERCQERELCPYEIAVLLATQSHVIVADYYYLFHPHIGGSFLAKTQKDLQECIVIVDEAHNLPQRIRETLSMRISSNTVKHSLVEAKKNKESAVIEKIVFVQDALNELAKDLKMGDERSVTRERFIVQIQEMCPYDELLAELTFVGDKIRETQHLSYVGRLADFLESWKNTEDGFARIITLIETQQKPNIVLSYRCLDPSIASREVVGNSHSTMLMSGTLTPTFMYKDLLGFPEDTEEVSLKSPFPKENRLALVVPETTTKFSRRNHEQYKQIGKVCTELIKLVPGNMAVFFPSYQFRDTIADYITSQKAVLKERSGATKAERRALLDKFKMHEKKGAVLLGVSSGSFGEGIDLPGDLLRGVVVVGMPFQTPDLETRELIYYYDRKFGKGWDYGYILPAITRILQNAGRCIRSETDRGVIVFLDERYAWPRYFKCFPSEWEVEICWDHKEKIEEFFMGDHKKL